MLLRTPVFVHHMSRMQTQCIFITLQLDRAIYYRVADKKFGFSNKLILHAGGHGKVPTVFVGYREKTDEVVYMEVGPKTVGEGELPVGTYLCQSTSKFPILPGGLLLVLQQLRWLRQHFALDLCKNEGGVDGLGWPGMYRPGSEDQRLFDLAEILPSVKQSFYGGLLFPNGVVAQAQAVNYPPAALAVLFSECSSFHMNHINFCMLLPHTLN